MKPAISFSLVSPGVGEHAGTHAKSAFWGITVTSPDAPEHQDEAEDEHDQDNRVQHGEIMRAKMARTSQLSG
jgi:hypothetical protein